MNKVILLGNIARDLDVRTLPNSGTTNVRTAIAVNRRWKAADGSQREEVMFIDIVAFGRQAEVMRDYMGKGRQILVEGRLNYSQWEDKNDGSKRSKHEVIVENFQMLGGRQDNAGGAPAQQQTQSQPNHNTPPPSDIDESDLPF